jgi:hypothetical protein
MIYGNVQSILLKSEYIDIWKMGRLRGVTEETKGWLEEQGSLETVGIRRPLDITPRGGFAASQPLSFEVFSSPTLSKATQTNAMGTEVYCRRRVVDGGCGGAGGRRGRG